MTGLQQVPLADALQALVDAGAHQQAAELAIRAAKRESLSPADPGEPGTRDYLNEQELRALDMAGVEELRTQRPEVYSKSLRMLGQKGPVER